MTTTTGSEHPEGASSPVRSGGAVVRVPGVDEDLLARVYAIPMRTRFRNIAVREGVLLRGPAGWGEFSPFREYGDEECVPWLLGAVEAATSGWPAPLRERVPVNCTVPVVTPAEAHRLVQASGCRTAKVKVADPGSSLAEDADRLAAVRDALGTAGAIRVDANAAWDVDAAVRAIAVLDRAAGGRLEYVEQPCRTLAELAEVRGRVVERGVRIAADESIRRAADPLAVAVAGAADVAVLKVAPLGGVRAALAVAEACGLPCVVSSALESGVGLSAGVALAGALPELDFACGLGTGSLLTSDGPVPAGGWLPVPRTPPAVGSAEAGLPWADVSTTRWWFDRLRRVAALAEEPRR